MIKDAPNSTPPAESKNSGTEINRSDLHAAPAYAELVESLLSQLEVFFSGKMAELFLAVDEHLFQSADHAKNTAEQNRLFEFMNVLRKKRENIGKNFFVELNKYLKPVAVSKELPKKKQHVPPGQTGLSLIDQDEMDEMITLTTITGKAAMDCREELSHLEARLEHLALQNRNIFHPKALDPTHICDAFQESLVSSEFDKINKLILYKMFGSEVIKHLKQLYDDLNGSMIRAGVLPQIEHTGKIRRNRESRQRTAEQAAPEAGNFNAEQQQGPLGRGGQQGGYYSVRGSGGGSGGSSAGSAQSGAGQGAAAGGGVAGYYGGGGSSSASTGRGAGVADGSGFTGGGAGGGSAGGDARRGGDVGQAGQGGSQVGGVASQEGTGSSTGNTGSSTGNINDQRMSAGFPAGQVRSRIAGFVGGDPVTADTSGGGADGAVYYTRQDVVTALSGMQNIVDVSVTAPLQFDAGAIKKAVLASIGERSGGALTKRVNQISEKTIDFIKLIFDAIIEDKGISDTIKALLLSLQIPIIKAAMLDADFFIDDKHPARQLLDRIAEAGVGINDRKDAVCIELSAIVRTLLKEYQEDIGAFSVALEAIKALTDRIYEQARQTEKLSQEQVRHSHARTVVLQEIRKITLGKELAPGIRVLVMKIWPSLMFNYYLRQGKANDEWVEMLMILAKIIESVQPHYSLDELQDQGLSYDDIVASVTEKLRKFRKTEAVIEQAIQDLRETYAKLDSRRVVKARRETNVPVKLNTTVAAVTAEAGAYAKSETISITEVTAETAMEMADDGETDEVSITPEKVARSKLDKLPSEVQPGSWFIVFNGENKPVRRLKLAVILMQDATMVFVDHLGNVVVEKDAEVFAEELVRGASGIIMQHSVFDHALRSALQTIPQH